MTLKDWEQVNRWLVVHETSKEEISDLVAVGDRKLKDAAIEALSADTRLALAYEAALEYARAALAAAGYRPSRGTDHHVRAIESLQYTLGWNTKRVRRLDAFRKARNVSSYERAGEVSNAQAAEIQEFAATLRAELLKWLHSEHPDLI